MKKFLSLVLALVMTMSLVTVSAGAKDFTDSTKIQYTEAVDVMSAVKVIDGYTDGSFNPTATLTRGAAAKIICNLILGPTTASALVADAAPYKDVPTNHTFAGYIAYCQKEGIISGYADGTFKPANSLTGYAFMKMLLGALGYKAENEGYTGANWSINVAKRAVNIGLKDGLIGDFNGVKAVNREEACLYAFNALQATMVEYDKNSTVTVGNITIKEQSDAKEMANTAKTETIKDDHKMQFAEKYFEDLKLEKGADDFGRPANTWKVKKEEVGTYANISDLVATYTKKATKADIYSAVGKTVYDDLTDTKDPATLTVWFDGVKTVVKAADVDSYIEKNNSGASNSTANGDLTEVYVDDDNNVTVVTARTYVFQASADYDSKKEQISLTTDDTKYNTDITLDDRTVSLDDFAAIKDLKEDDYVLVTAVVNKAGKYEIKSIEKAETKTGEVTGYKYESNVTVGSETYSYSATAKKASGNASGIKSTNYNVGKQATLVFDKYGYIIAVEESVVLSDYVFIEEFGSTSGLNKKAVANAVFPDGTDAEIVVKEAYSITDKKQVTDKSAIAKWTAADHAGWYTYSKNSSNEYTLYNVEKKYERVSDTVSYGTQDTVVSLNSKVAPFSSKKLADTLANNDTVVIVNDTKGDYTVYTGVKNFPGITLTEAKSTAAVYAIQKNNGYASLIYIDVDGSATITGDKNSNLVYVISYDGKYVTTDNETFYKYTVLDGEDEVKVEADSKIHDLGDVYQVANYLTKNKDRLTDFQLVKKSDGGVVIGGEDKTSAISQSAGTLTIGGEKYLVAEDAKITLVTLGALDKKNKVDASVMNKDKDADYEVSANMTASGLIDALKGYTYTYDFGGKLTENAASNGNTIKELYVTITYAESTSTPGTPSTPTQQNLIDSFTVNGKAYTIAGAYDTVKAAVENATKVQMADAAIKDYVFVANTKQVDTNGEVVTTGGTHAYGTYGIFGTKDAALTFTAPAKFTDSLNGQTITDANASAGDYIVLATENHGTVTYYAYYLAK